MHVLSIIVLELLVVSTILGLRQNQFQIFFGNAMFKTRNGLSQLNVVFIFLEHRGMHERF